MDIKNIRFNSENPNKIDFNYDNKTFTIKAPLDVILINQKNADKWIMKHYGFLLRGGI